MNEEKKILIYTDLHKWDRDFETIRGFVKATERIHEDLCVEAEDGKYHAIISTGDLHHSGYRSPAHMISHRNRHQRLTDAVRGNHYICRGNHMFIERDDNPTIYLIQPHPTIKPLTEFYSEKPVIQSPDYIIIDKVQISFFHYDKDNKNYFRMREAGVETHIGIFHDSCILPQSVRDDMHQHIRVDSEYIKAVYSDLDMAIAGHVHTKLGWKMVDIGTKKVPLYIPGALGISSSKEVERHDFVNLPVLTINGAKVDVSYLKQSTYVETMEFRKSDKAIIKNEVEMEMVNESFDFANIKNEDVRRILDTKLDLPSYLRERGYSDRSVKLVERAALGKLEIADAVRIYKGEVVI